MQTGGGFFLSGLVPVIRWTDVDDASREVSPILDRGPDDRANGLAGGQIGLMIDALNLGRALDSMQNVRSFICGGAVGVSGR